MSGLKDEIHQTLHQLHAAQRAHDLDAMLEVYAFRGYLDKSALRENFKALMAQDAFRDRDVDFSACETFVYRDSALVKPVVYHTRKGRRSFSFHLANQEGGRWRIIDNRRAQLPGEPVYSPLLVANAGKVVGNRGMLWIRRLDVPLEDVWHAVSTKEGLDRWWLTRDVEIDLRPGGLFKHHWTNTVRDFRTNEFIDFVGVPDDADQRDNLMRFELQADGSGTVFAFFDAFQAHPLPLSLPWTASGWHCTIDALETALTGRTIENDFGLGGDFYWS
jgi:uncharacterized protein YndB with AHSA1/START domain